MTMTAREAALQAKIDALMLEYCPEDMTPEQIENWNRHQRAATPEEEANIERALLAATLSDAPASDAGTGLTIERIEEFRREYYIPPQEGDDPWVSDNNRVLDFVCDAARAALLATSAAGAAVDRPLNLCKRHRQEWKQSEYAEHNCDYCRLAVMLAAAPQPAGKGEDARNAARYRWLRERYVIDEAVIDAAMASPKEEK